MQAVAALINDI